MIDRRRVPVPAVAVAAATDLALNLEGMQARSASSSPDLTHRAGLGGMDVAPLPKAADVDRPLGLVADRLPGQGSGA
jgi:hypothetical protein